ncbi:M81 family metallopeptidase [Aquamicrobium sp. LC103]|uniref:M81 family metallopeptidase n=1 Tax=Aquamicrobium sp. LC103 TaxID=1120658 RepID=UPI00063E759A|nr:M81 family metallopeptidase [Aquamicrobium sp. LC103]TKT69243.1 M81 family metallopeptidase [Aquamicrobium sp. LC103]
MKMFMAGLVTETNTFSPLPTGMLSFEEGGIYHGDATAQPLQYWTAPLHIWKHAATERGWDITEGLMAVAQPAGPTVRSTYETLRGEILDNLRAAMPVDIVLLSMHGAMIADGYDDCEGDLISHCRKIAGDKVIIGGLLDPHSHLTDMMMENATLLVPYKEYPHVDVPDRARDLFALAVDAAEGRTNPVMRDHDCRIICAMHTPYEPMRSFVDGMSAREGKDGVLHVGLVHGFPWGDHPRAGARSLVTTNGNAAQAEALAKELAGELLSIRGRLNRTHPTIDAALDRGMEHAFGPVVLADVADNAGGGAPGDATFLLRAILDRGITNAVVGIFWDPMAMRICREADEGATLNLRLGGKYGPMSGDPLDLRVTIRRLASDLSQRFGDLPIPLGNMAWLECDGVDIVVNDLRTQTFHPEAYTGLGIDLASRKLVCVKSSQHFHAGFAPIAAEVIHVATPGSITPDYANIAYIKRAPNYWPKMEDPFA